MRSEAEVRRAVDRLRHAISKFDEDDPESEIIIVCMRGQIDVLLWALDEPNGWDKVHEIMNAFYFEHGEAPTTTN